MAKIPTLLRSLGHDFQGKHPKPTDGDLPKTKVTLRFEQKCLNSSVSLREIIQ